MVYSLSLFLTHTHSEINHYPPRRPQTSGLATHSVQAAHTHTHTHTPVHNCVCATDEDGERKRRTGVDGVCSQNTVKGGHGRKGLSQDVLP